MHLNKTCPQQKFLPIDLKLELKEPFETLCYVSVFQVRVEWKAGASSDCFFVAVVSAF